MRTRPVIGVLAAAIVALAGCGSGKKTPSTTPSTTTRSASTGTTPPPKLRKLVRIYNLSLSGSAAVPPGPRSGTGSVTITLIGKEQLVCWSFSRLSGFDLPPTVAQIHVGARGKTGGLYVPLSVKYLPRACIHQSASQVEALANDPSGYYVIVESKKHPAGAVRAQL